MVKEILRYDIEKDLKILSKKSELVSKDEDIKNIINDLKDTMKSNKNSKGISAVQIGVLKRICICSWGGQEIIMINPEIKRTRGEQLFEEGCLSIPGQTKNIMRNQKVWCEYFDENWNKREIAEGGRMSNIIQHELDHLNGISKIYEKIKDENGK